MAFRSAFLCNVASCYDKCDILLGNHAPKVLECVVEGPLRRDYLPIPDLTQWTVHEISIDVAIYDSVSRGHAGPRHEYRSGVLERLDIDITVLVIELS